MSQETSRHHIAILGGTGFVGRALCRRLSNDGHRLRVVTRNAAPHSDMSRQVELREGDPHDRGFLAEALTDCDVAINLIGILNERGHSGREFRAVHTELPRTLGRACRDAGIERVLHMSALGARAGSAPSRYLRSKGEGANALQVELGGRIPWTMFEPSVIFGPGDDFTNRFATLLRFMPGVFPLACAETRFAPVYVEDVAEAFARSLDEPASHNHRYQICGPREYSLREIVEYLGRTSGHPRRVLGLSDTLAKLQANILEYVPGKPFSRDNYLSMQIDSVCESANGSGFDLAALGITPTPMERIVPGYLQPRGGA